MDLSHPLHDADKDEFPAHHLASLKKVFNPATNKLEPTNLMTEDEWNLMGYNGSLAQRAASRKPLRYLQWKKCKRS
jgi:hypothetical protein